MTYEQIKSNYDKKLWTKQMVKICVTRGLITPAQYQEITGDAYTA
jgi:uncharacterized XkdX family phage protein